MFYIQRTKWQVGKVTVVHTGPFKTKDEAVERLRTIRYNKFADLSIIEKE